MSGAVHTQTVESKVATRLKRLGPNLSLTGVIITLTVGVIVPVLLSTSVGIFSLTMGEGTVSLVTGILVICFTAAAIGGAVTATVLVGRKARTARLQADFLANVSHELRTPLAAIRMYAQTLESGKLVGDPIQTAACLDTIVRETRWLETMIDRVLTWRSAAQDRRVLNPRVATLAEALTTVQERFVALVPPGAPILERDIRTEALVNHDPEGMATALINLLINAYKYSTDEKRIILRAFDREEQVIIEVEDNGIGIPLLERRRVFEPFYRVDPRLRSRSSGMGLGLAIVKAMVEAHQGEIELESAPVGGTLFRIRLPVAEPPLPAGAAGA